MIKIENRKNATKTAKLEIERILKQVNEKLVSINECVYSDEFAFVCDYSSEKTVYSETAYFRIKNGYLELRTKTYCEYLQEHNYVQIEYIYNLVKVDFSEFSRCLDQVIEKYNRSVIESESNLGQTSEYLSKIKIITE